jgi:hypothetical protein
VHHQQKLVSGGLVRPLVRTLAIASTKVKLQTLDLLFKMATMDELLANGFFDYIPDLLKEKDVKVLAQGIFFSFCLLLFCVPCLFCERSKSSRQL